LVRALPHGTQSPRLLVGRDTRESGAWIEAELAYGASVEGATVTSAGIVPTPAVAYLTRLAYDAGVVISASHNPFEDNGIKVFSGRGEVHRTSSSARSRPSSPIRHGAEGRRRTSGRGGRSRPARIWIICTVFPEAPALLGFKLAIDCANGATTTVGPKLFGSLGFLTFFIGNQPDGRNINLHCGSTHRACLREPSPSTVARWASR
jgi:phosphoglucosamine mutase